MRNLIFVAAMLVCFGCARDEQASSTTSAATPPPPDQSTPQGGPAEISTMAVTLEPTQGNATRGTLTLAPVAAGGVRISGSISGLKHNSEHGFHIHENGDCSAPDASSAGGHFNPLDKPHGAPGSGSHVGDLGNITADANGVATIDVQAPKAALEGATPGNIRGKAIIVHGGRDDLSTQPSGDSGNRLACGVIPG